MSTLLRTVEAFPRGRTTDELYALLDVDFNAARREQILAELIALQKRGVVTLGRDNKWRAVSRTVAAAGRHGTGAGPGAGADPGAVLQAVPAGFSRQADRETAGSEDGGDTAQINPIALLRYYRAALQSDPRGALTQADDRHGTAYQLICGAGDPFPEDGETGIIRVTLDHLPDSFREALSRREANDRALAIGWPISIARKSGAPAIRPVGLIAATWERSGEQLVIRIAADDVMVNPDWIRAAASGTAWTAIALRDIFAGQGGAGLSRDDFLLRLREAAAKSIRGKITGRRFATSLDPADGGIFDAMGLFLPTESSFTAGAVRDLDQIATWAPEKIARTALGPLLGLKHDGEIPADPPINVGPLNHEQIRAVANAAAHPLSVVTGPPGTGKSQAIVAMAATTLLRGGSVIVASKNHQALDAVEQRLSEIAPDVPFMVRTLDPAREIDQGMTDVVAQLVNDPGGAPGLHDPVLADQLADLAGRRLQALDMVEARRALNLQLADLIETLDLRADDPEPNPATRPEARGLLARLLRWLLPGRFGPAGAAGDPPPSGRAALEAKIRALRAELAQLAPPPDPVDLTRQIEPLAKTVMRQTLGARAALTEDQRIDLSNRHDDLALHGGGAMSRDLAQTVLDHRPLWLASVLGTPRRIPLYEGLFDLVIFDEASQCDIASALPLLARAKRAVIVGDDRQLAFISQIGLSQDRNLMAANGLPDSGTGRFSQGRKSLFDLARGTPGVPAVMLRDQYRSAEGIVDYINTQFYGGKLRVAADLGALKLPKGRKPGLAWTHVPGPGRATSTAQNVNLAEVAAITREVQDLLQNKGYEGTVGVIAPFRPQVHALTQALRQALPDACWARADLRVGTVDGFQGQERDLILFSPTVHDGAAPSAVTFLVREWRRMNVAISRARAVAHVFGDLDYARSGKVGQLRSLAARATEPRGRSGEDVFESGWERIVFHALKARGLDPQPQYEIAGRRLDFALFGANGVKLDLEIDGRRWHQDADGNRKIDDHWRDHQMRALGWKVRRFWVDELKQDMEGCLDLVERDLKD
ncbi:AAA domain-containing protein [Jhaorihella thermophila]|uniref:Uncharacterized protein n=1 Tax=Jhaorihella thermophila TaxID=488547 RepID=A0A1H5YHZ4_9RHOB|nr:AAA domain-containing protein [Jhaorihella thermophila]SEG23769.1 Protein of unknown function [Jhaorihella thermophila]